MPSKALHFCAHHGCDELTTDRYCDKHKAEHEVKERERKQEFEKTRKSASERGYDSKWQKARKAYLIKHPICVECEKENIITPATVVDHIVPHKGDKKLFWDRNNWQSLCKRHHDIKTAKEDGRWGQGG